MKQVTTQDIADALQISRNTVSRSLHGQPGVGAETRQRVQQMAKQLGYQSPEAEVPTVSPASTKKIALVATQFTLGLRSFFGVILTQLQRKMRQSGYQLDVFSVTEQMRDQLDIPTELTTDHYQGLFVLSFISAEYTQALLDLKLPTVLIDDHSPELVADSVLTENIDGTQKAMHYLAAHGYRKIGFIGNISFSPSYMERFLGLRLAIDSHPLLSLADEHTITDVREDNPPALFSRLQQLTTMPDVWFTVNNGYASMLVTHLQGSGYAVPQDVGIMAFDDTDIAQMLTPQLTVIATDLKEMANQSFQLLMTKIGTGPTTQQVYIRLMPKIIERSSIVTGQ
jgi:LacI family transcriptional regulator